MKMENLFTPNRSVFRSKKFPVPITAPGADFSQGTMEAGTTSASVEKVAGQTKVAQVVAMGQETFNGGAITHSFAISGLLATDKVFAQLQQSSSSAAVQKVTPAATTLSLQFSKDPGTGSKLNYAVMRAV